MSKSGSATTQLSINFDSGLLERFPKFEECLRHCVHSSKRQQKYIAADLNEAGPQNIDSSKLGRMLGEYDPNEPQYPARLLPDLIESAEDLTPVYWLIERFLDDPGERRQRAMDALADLLPQLESLLERAKEDDEPAVRAVD